MAGARAGPVAELADDRERRGTGGLVREHEPCRAEPARNHGYPTGCARPARNSRRTKSVISSIEASLENPAACRWPPPPDLRAIADTSSSSTLARRLTRRVGPS